MSSILSSDILGPPPGTKVAEITVTAPRKKDKQRSPQQIIDDFWDKFTTKTPGKATSIIPQNEYAEKAAKRSIKRLKAPAQTTQAAFDEAAAICQAKVHKIIKECRRINQKYRDPHFDLEADLKLGRRDCLESLDNWRDKNKRKEPDNRDKADFVTAPSATATDATALPIKRPHPNGDIDTSFHPMAVKRVIDIFDDPHFYVDGPTANDVRQGRDGDCWLMAALCTLSNKPGLIERICVAHDQAVGVYGFVFHRDGEWISEIIDDKLYLTKPDYDEVNLERILWEDRERLNSEESYRKIYQSNSGALYFAQCENPNETWLPLLEKAYAKAHGDYAALEGGFTGEGIEDLTGGVTSEIYTTDILDKEYFWKEELLKVNEEFLFGCSTGVWGNGWGERKGIVELHAYSVLRAVEVEGMRLVLLKNPWGKHEWKGAWSDGSKEWTPEWLTRLGHRFGDDGAFWISYEDLLRKYQAFDRTRLFGDDWKVASIWTTLTVPWTLEYNDTRFAFTLSRPGPIVLALSQLDDRYFRGLEGQYRFELSFRLHNEDNEDEDDYVVRSQTAYRMNRSINVELTDLPAGAYTVLVKIDAQRDDRLMPAEEVVRASAKTRREKLIRTGLAYDLAHGKGKIVETEAEKKAREAHEKRRRKKARDDLREKCMEVRRRNYYLDIKDLEKKKRRAAKAKAKKAAKAEKQRAEREERRKAEQEAYEKEMAERAKKRKEKGKDEIKQPGENGEDAVKSDGAVPTPDDQDKAATEKAPKTAAPGESERQVDGSKTEKKVNLDEGETKPTAADGDDADSTAPPQSTPATTAASLKSVSEKGDTEILQPDETISDPQDGDTPPARKRIAVACGRCRKLEIRCSGDAGNLQPCTNCKNAGAEPCQFLRPYGLPPSVKEEIGADSVEPSSTMVQESVQETADADSGKLAEKTQDGAGKDATAASTTDTAQDVPKNEATEASAAKSVDEPAPQTVVGKEKETGPSPAEKSDPALEAEQKSLTTPVSKTASDDVTPTSATSSKPAATSDKPDEKGPKKASKHVDLGVQAELSDWSDDEYVHVPTSSAFDRPHHTHPPAPRACPPGDPRRKPPPLGGRPPRGPGYHHPPPPPPHSGRPGLPSHSSYDSLRGADTDFDSVSEISDMSDTELDYRLDVQEQMQQAQAAQGVGGALGVGGSAGVGLGSLPPPPPPLTVPGEVDDDDEKEPWNAVVVVGLRVYYKVQEGEAEDVEVVKMGVVRPNPFLKDELDDEEKSKKEKESEGGKDLAKVLDVDDSQKDATVTSDDLKVEGEKEAKKEEASGEKETETVVKQEPPSNGIKTDEKAEPQKGTETVVKDESPSKETKTNDEAEKKSSDNVGRETEVKNDRPPKDTKASEEPGPDSPKPVETKGGEKVTEIQAVPSKAQNDGQVSQQDDKSKDEESNKSGK